MQAWYTTSLVSIVSTDPVEIPLDALMPPVSALPEPSVGVEILSVHFIAVTSSNLVELCLHTKIDS